MDSSGSKVPVNRRWPIKKVWYRRVNTSFKETSSGVFASIQMNGDWCSIFLFFAHYICLSIVFRCHAIINLTTNVWTVARYLSYMELEGYVFSLIC